MWSGRPQHVKSRDFRINNQISESFPPKLPNMKSTKSFSLISNFLLLSMFFKTGYAWCNAGDTSGRVGYCMTMAECRAWKWDAKLDYRSCGNVCFPIPLNKAKQGRIYGVVSFPLHPRRGGIQIQIVVNSMMVVIVDQSRPMETVTIYAVMKEMSVVW
jgi:hypothetical protein